MTKSLNLAKLSLYKNQLNLSKFQPNKNKFKYKTNSNQQELLQMNYLSSTLKLHS